MGRGKTRDEGKIAVELLGNLVSAKTECPDNGQGKRESLTAKKVLASD